MTQILLLLMVLFMAAATIMVVRSKNMERDLRPIRIRASRNNQPRRRR